MQPFSLSGNEKESERPKLRASKVERFCQQLTSSVYATHALIITKLPKELAFSAAAGAPTVLKWALQRPALHPRE